MEHFRFFFYFYNLSLSLSLSLIIIKIYIIRLFINLINLNRYFMQHESTIYRFK